MELETRCLFSGSVFHQGGKRLLLVLQKQVVKLCSSASVGRDVRGCENKKNIFILEWQVLIAALLPYLPGEMDGNGWDRGLVNKALQRLKDKVSKE